VLRKFACDVAILQESKLEVVGCPVVVSLWGRRQVLWPFLPSVGRSAGIIIIWDPQFFELEDFKIGSFSVCCKFKSLHDSFVWGFIRVYGHDNDRLRDALFEELMTFISIWDIPWCLSHDFNVVRFPSERALGGRLTSTMSEFSDFIDSCNLIDLPLEGGRFTWSSHEEVPVLS